MKIPINVTTVVVTAVFVQWLVFATRSMFSRAKLPKGQKMRSSELHLLISGAVLLAGWVAVFVMPMLAGAMPAKTAKASAAGATSHATCASVTPGQNAADIETSLGKPDEKLNDETVRGPGATTWLYRDARCAVHVLDGKVDFVE
jgi:hypothetical protein